jgi:hypothetical protein
MLLRPKITCASGFVFSVQAGRTHYCTPRMDYADRYTHVEVGFPSKRVEALMEYIDGSEEDPTQTVYGYVPVEVIIKIIQDEGGSTDLFEWHQPGLPKDDATL